MRRVRCARLAGVQHVRVQGQGSAADELEARVGEQACVVVGPAFATSDVAQHVQVPGGGQRGGTVDGQETFHDEQVRVVGHRADAVAQDLAAAVVVPVVQDAGQDVDVAAGWHVGEVARTVVAARSAARGVEQTACGLDGVRAFEEDTAQARVRREDPAEEFPVPSGDVHDGRGLGCLGRGGDDGMGGKRLEHP